MTASVVICSRGRPELLHDTVRSVLDGDSLPGEIVVVDQSDSAHAELAGLGEVRGCTVRYLHSATTGLSRARNIGIEAAAGEFVVLIDDDMLVRPDWLGNLLAGRGEDPDTVATGRVLAAPPEAGLTVPPAALVLRDSAEVFRGPQPLDVVPGANVAMSRERVLGLGGYDERLGAGTRFAAADDNDMGHRLLAAGCEVRHVPEAVVFHRPHRAQGELVRLKWRYGRGKGAFYAKHARRDPHIRRRILADARARIGRAIGGLLRAPRASAAEVVSLAGMASGALDWLVRERSGGSR